jgi:hypothetical protein
MDIRQVFESLKDYVESGKALDRIVLSVNQGKSDLQTRVFNSEKGAKDVQGSGLGKYSNTYAKYRQNNGRQTNVVDLEYTGSLRRNFQVTQVGTRAVIVVPDSKERQKIGYLETQYKKNIFSLSKEEKLDINKRATILITEDITEIIKSGLK